MRWAAALLLLAATPASLGQRTSERLAAASPGTRLGLLVVDDQGREIVALLPDQRFVPASNTKMFTTAALFASGTDLDAPDVAGGASIRLDGRDIVLSGHGDARLSAAADCVADCLATLADAVAQALSGRTRTVRDVIGDDSWFPDERWSPGMSWNNMAVPSGTGISALSIDGNEVALTVSGGGVAGNGYYRIENRVTAGAVTALGYDRAPGSRTVRVTGTLAAGATKALSLGVEDPADYAAWQLAAMLRARGVRVNGSVSARHRPLDSGDDPARRGTMVARAPEPAALAQLQGPPLRETATITNKVSQNVYAELILRRVGRLAGTGSIADGQVAVARMLAAAGVPRVAYDFSDGSGMSNYNRVSPRATVTFLRWAARQPWGAAWRATLPMSGEGTLRRRFVGGPAVAAKTGTLNGTSALAGWIRAKSGRELVFAAYAGDVPGDGAVNAAMDAALVAIAAEN